MLDAAWCSIPGDKTIWKCNAVAHIFSSLSFFLQKAGSTLTQCEANDTTLPLSADTKKMTNHLLIFRYCIRTLPRGGMYWERHPPRPERFTKGGDFAPRGLRGMYFPMHPDLRQCTSILSALAGKYWFSGVFFIWNLKDLPHSASACTEWALHQPKIL